MSVFAVLSGVAHRFASHCFLPTGFPGSTHLLDAWNKCKSASIGWVELSGSVFTVKINWHFVWSFSLSRSLSLGCYTESSLGAICKNNTNKSQFWQQQLAAAVSGYSIAPFVWRPLNSRAFSTKLVFGFANVLWCLSGKFKIRRGENKEVRLLLKARDTAFRSGEAWA